jgi:hypothetical protein
MPRTDKDREARFVPLCRNWLRQKNKLDSARDRNASPAYVQQELYELKRIARDMKYELNN